MSGLTRVLWPEALSALITSTGSIEHFSPVTGSQFSIIKQDNATGDFTRVAQRVPVRIAIEPGQKGSDQLTPGLSVVTSVDTKQF